MTTPFRRRVEHVDTDASGVVHFSRYVSLMETVVLEFLEEREAGLAALAEFGVELAVTQLQVSYSRPMTYRDVVVGQAHVEHVGRTRRRDPGGGRGRGRPGRGLRDPRLPAAVVRPG